jgi:ribosomal protein S1
MIFRTFIIATIAIVVVRGWNLHAFRSNRIHKWNFDMAADTETATEIPASNTPKKYISKDRDVSRFVEGQQYEGTLVAAKVFGVFVKVEGTDVLLPKSVLSRSAFDKLKNLVESKSTKPIKIEIMNVNIQNQTLSGKYIPSSDSISLSTSDIKELKSRFFNATVVSTHDFGIFAQIDESDIDGLVPVSLLPDKTGNLKQLYP